MTLSWSSRVVRGGSAVQTVYWRALDSKNAPKLVKHGRVLRLSAPKDAPPPAVVQQRLVTSSHAL